MVVVVVVVADVVVGVAEAEDEVEGVEAGVVEAMEAEAGAGVEAILS